jgi:hypothetical protein
MGARRGGAGARPAQDSTEKAAAPAAPAAAAAHEPRAPILPFSHLPAKCVCAAARPPGPFPVAFCRLWAPPGPLASGCRRPLAAALSWQPLTSPSVPPLPPADALCALYMKALHCSCPRARRPSRDPPCLAAAPDAAPAQSPKPREPPAARWGAAPSCPNPCCPPRALGTTEPPAKKPLQWGTRAAGRVAPHVAPHPPAPRPLARAPTPSHNRRHRGPKPGPAAHPHNVRTAAASPYDATPHITKAPIAPCIALALSHAHATPSRATPSRAAHPSRSARRPPYLSWKAITLRASAPPQPCRGSFGGGSAAIGNTWRFAAVLWLGGVEEAWTGGGQWVWAWGGSYCWGWGGYQARGGQRRPPAPAQCSEGAGRAGGSAGSGAAAGRDPRGASKEWLGWLHTLRGRPRRRCQVPWRRERAGGAPWAAAGRGSPRSRPPRATARGRRGLPVPQQPVHQPHRCRQRAAGEPDEPSVDAHGKQQQAAQGVKQPEAEAHELAAAAAHGEQRVEHAVRREAHLARRVVRRAWRQMGVQQGQSGV